MIHDTYINVIIQFNKKVANTIPSGKNDGKNDSDFLIKKYNFDEKSILMRRKNYIYSLI